MACNCNYPRAAQGARVGRVTGYLGMADGECLRLNGRCRIFADPESARAEGADSVVPVRV